MKRWKQTLKRTVAGLVAAVIVTGSLDITTLVVSAEEQVMSIEEQPVTVELPTETYDLPQIETSAQFLSLFALDESGELALKEGNYANWIDRIDATGADYVETFYGWLEDNSNPATIVSNPTAAALYDPVGNTTGELVSRDSDKDNIDDTYLYLVKEFTGSDTYNYTGDSNADAAAARNAVSDDLSANGNEAFAYITGVYSAFDRDHPEVFWLTGASKMQYSASYSYSKGTVNYNQWVYFVLKTPTFDIRDESYQDTDTLMEAVNDTLVKADSDKAKVLAGVLEGADTYETVRYFNEWLTKNNCYNSDVNNAGHDARECTSALSGSTGTTGPVCEAYARAFKVLCDASSIPCVLVDGTAINSSGSGPHMWNYVQMDDDKWYAVDVTWNDPTVSGVTSAVSGRENENYFLVGSETVIGGMSFIASHPVSNTVTTNGVAFTNGPLLEESSYVYVDLKTPLNADDVALSDNSVTFNGTEQKPTVTVAGLTEGVDYTVTFPEDMTSAGEKTIKVVGKGAYKGSVEVVFTINKATVDTLSIAGFAGNVQQNEAVTKVYDGTKKYVGPAVLEINMMDSNAHKIVSVIPGEDCTAEMEYTTANVGCKEFTLSITISEELAGNFTNNKTTFEQAYDNMQSIITARPITVTAENQVVPVGGVLDGSKVTVGGGYGLLDGHTISATFEEADTSLIGEQTLTIDTITVTDAEENDVTANYSVTGKVAGILEVKRHTHEWQYTASGNVITAHCISDFGTCSDSEQEMVIVEPTEGLVYDKKAKLATIEGTIDGVDEPEIVYEGELLVDGKPVNAGEYTAKIAVGGVEAVSDIFVIGQADAPGVAWPTASGLVYGQTLAESVLSGGSMEYGTFAWEDATAIPTTGESAYNVVFTPTELTVRNYKNMEVTKQPVSVKVIQATPTYPNPIHLTAKYGQTLKQVALPEGWSWDAPETSVGNVGTKEFAATYTPEDIANYNIVQKNLSVKVEPFALSVTGVTAENKIYDGTNAVKITGVTLSGVLSGDEVFVSLEGLTGTVSSADVGDYDAVVLPEMILRGAASSNYTLVQPAQALPVQVSIWKSEASITLKKDVYRKVYGDEAFSIAEDIMVVGDAKLVYSVSNGLDSKGQPKAADDIVAVTEDGLVTILGSGSVTVTLSMEETVNYFAVSQTISIQVMAWDEISQNGFFVKSMDIQTYTGNAIKPEPEVYDGNGELRLEKGRDYTISYKNNKKAYTLKEGDNGFDAKKAPAIIIKGKGNYDQTLTVYFTIQPKDIADLDDTSVVAEDIVLEENGKTQKKAPVVKFHNKKLGKADVEVTYPAGGTGAYVAPGTYPIIITGKGNFTGSRTVNLIIAKKGASLAKASIGKIPVQEFDGVNAVELDEKELIVTAKVNGKKEILKKGVHYNVEYTNNKAIGTATVTVRAIEGSGFAGFKKASFKIAGVSIAKARVEGIEDKKYTGSAQETELKVSLGNVLAEGKDYVVTYSKNTNVGTATVTIQGIGKYTGTIKKTFKITGANIADLVTVKDGEMSAKYVKGGAKPSLELVFNGKILTEGKDYIVTYKNNKSVYTAKAGEAGYDDKKAPILTIKGKGNFAGSVSRTFVITGRSLTDAEVTATMSVADKAVSDKKGGYISKVVIIDADGKTLKEGTDYSAPVYTMLNEKNETVVLTKEDTAPVGSVITVSVAGMGAYEDATGKVLTATYRITAKDFTKAKVQGIQKKYTGKKVELTANDFLNEDGTSKVTVGGESLAYGKDFEVVPGSYKNNLKKGTATVTIRGLGEYGGTKTVKFKIGARSLWLWWL